VRVREAIPENLTTPPLRNEINENCRNRLSLCLLMGSITAFFYLVYLESGSSSPQKKPGVATVIETRSSIREQYPSVNDLRQNDAVGQNHSFCIDSAIKRTLRDQDSFEFISATLWTPDSIYAPKAWICQAEYRSKNAFGGYGLPEEVGIIFDADGCRVLSPILEKKSDAMAASERKTLMYAIKIIHDPFNNAR
jgi:hypothetical protein